MLKELVTFLRGCPYTDNITSCASYTNCDSISVMPLKGLTVKKYTDGREIKTINVALLKKTFYSPNGDTDFETDTFFENVAHWLKAEFNKGDIYVSNYRFVLVEPADTYTIDTFSSIGIYSLKLKVVYEEI